MRTDKDTIAVRIVLSVLFLVKNKRDNVFFLWNFLSSKKNETPSDSNQIVLSEGVSIIILHSDRNMIIHDR